MATPAGSLYSGTSGTGREDGDKHAVIYDEESHSRLGKGGSSGGITMHGSRENDFSSRHWKGSAGELMPHTR